MSNSKRSTRDWNARLAIEKVQAISPEERKQMISETAYYLAEQRGFTGNCQLHDWLEAEEKINHIYGPPISAE